MAKKAEPSQVNPGATASFPEGSAEVPEDFIGDRIREAREALGLSQTALATRTKLSDKKGVGISRTVIVGYEAGTHKPGARELRILCETLGVTPNWMLYRKDAPFEVQQASMDFIRGSDEIKSAFRLALAVLVLKPHERDLVGSLVLSIAGRALGDARLSSLGVTATMFANEAKDLLSASAPGWNAAGESIEAVMQQLSREGASNFGNRLKFDEEGKPSGGEWLYPDPETPGG